MPRRRKTNGTPADLGGLPAAVPGPTQAPAVPTGQPYGQAKALTQAQQAVPLADARAPMERVVAAATGFDPSSGVTPLSAPSTRPGEPVTTGLPVGAGAGPEVMRSAKPTVSSTLSMLAQLTGDPEIASLAMRAQGGGL